CNVAAFRLGETRMYRLLLVSMLIWAVACSRSGTAAIAPTTQVEAARTVAVPRATVLAQVQATAIAEAAATNAALPTRVVTPSTPVVARTPTQEPSVEYRLAVAQRNGYVAANDPLVQ